MTLREYYDNLPKTKQADFKAKWLEKTKKFDKSKLQLVKLPAACPELNPVERFFKEVRRQLKSRVFDTLELAQQAVEDAVEKVSESAQKVISLTCFPYIKNTSS